MKYIGNKLDIDFLPISKFMKQFSVAVNSISNKETIFLSFIRNDNQVFTIKKYIFPKNHFRYEDNKIYIERYIKTILWLKGAYRILFSGDKELFNYLNKIYSKNGKRAFDVEFLSSSYQKKFEIVYVDKEDIIDTNEKTIFISRNLNGYRIGFDAGGSDRKVSAVVDGKVIFSDETIWHPKTMEDPNYHLEGIIESLQKAANKLPRVDSIGISTAGIIIDNYVAAASLFRKVPKKMFEKYVRTIYLDAAKVIADVPVKVINDGDVSALAGSMSLNKNSVLGIAMGTSLAVGYVDRNGNITGWLNELSFAPLDLALNAPIDEWSGDRGTGVSYLSQDAVIRLASEQGLILTGTPAEKLAQVQAMLPESIVAKEIFMTIGYYLGHALAYYDEFYEIENVLLLGRVMSKKGGELILESAIETIKREYPSLSQKINITLPDEKMRRVGQSIAAASLPSLKGE